MYCKKIKLIEGRDDVTLTTYVWADSPNMLNGKKRPAVIVCPGGAYLGCSDNEGEPIALAFAAMGYHAFVLRYSTFNNGQMAAFVGDKKPEINPNSIHPAPMRDIARAMIYIKDHSDEWLVDEENIAICGFSAGAHNCAMYSVYWDKPIMNEPFGVDVEKLRPAAAILGYGLSDYVFMKTTFGHMDEMGQGLFKLANLAFTGMEDPDDAKLEEISPARHVGKNTPPTFIWATSADDLVPVAHSTLMATGLANAGIPFEMHIFEKGGHGLALATQASAGAKPEINPDAAQWIPLVQKWLEKHMPLNLPAISPWMAALGIEVE